MTARPLAEPRVRGVSSPSSNVDMLPKPAANRSASPSTRKIPDSAALQRFNARSATAFSMGRTSPGELEITRKISLMAVCWSSASLVSLKSRTLSMAIAAVFDRIACQRPDDVAFDKSHARERRIAQVRRPLGDGVEHRLHVGGRAGDHAQDFAARRLLLERILELARAFLDFALQARVRLAQLRAHVVEAVGERLELVAGAHVDLLVEIALADAPRAFVERAYRPHHTACERHRAERGDHEAGE